MQEERFVICRCTAAGVHAGWLVARNGSEVTLRRARRLWEWRVPMGAPAFLSGVATAGLGENCEVGCPIDVHLTEVCEIINTTPEAQLSIEGYESAKRTI